MSQDFGCYDYTISNEVKLTSKYRTDRNNGLNDFELPKNTTDGFFVRYYPCPPNSTPILKDSGQVYQGKKSQEWKEYSRNGLWLHQGDYRLGLREGLWKSFWIRKNDTLLSDSYEYKEGKLDGSVKRYIDGQLLSSKTFKDGELHGKTVHYNDFNRNLPSSIEHYKNGLLHGLFIEFTGKNDTSFVATYKDGQLDGKARYFKDGRIEVSATFKEGVLEGIYQHFHNNGVLFWEAIFKNDLPYSIISVFDSTGQALQSGDFKNGYGQLNHYYPNGSIKSTANYKNGLLNGSFAMYFADGQIQERGVIMGIPKKTNEPSPYRLWIKDLNLFAAKKQTFEGSTNYKIFDKEGLPKAHIKSITSDDSIEVLESKFYSYTSKEIVQKSYSFKGVTVGKYKLYYHNGIIKLEGQYKNVFENDVHRSFKHGLFISYFENGAVQSKILYNLGQETDSSLFFDEEGNLVRKKLIAADGSVCNIFEEDTVNATDENGLKQGKWIYFPTKYEFAECSTTPTSVQFFNDDIPVGKWLDYDLSGRLIVTYEWIDTNFAICNRYYFSEHLIASGYVDRDFRSWGVWETYYENSNKVRERGEVRDDQRHGTWLVYKKNGKVKKEINYYYGNEF